MLQCQCLKIPVKPEKTETLLAWIGNLKDRKDEVLEALSSEGINDEAVFVSQEGDRHFLYLYSRSEDLEAAAMAFQQSNLAVDVEFKSILAECLDFPSALALNPVFYADGRERSVVCHP
ncbi:DUF6176 family protein [Saccharospirillum salsuginis]|uniref:Uncharacterized protein n=1 Tax=Saccharospirillum salsuginis TaxID=418750 RepID=A0A918KG81_9GAMM|nr:DUF6176 family protein [Saccharospirillum salsuginis]GGX62633.1 hypothetical protein GCM10007392_33170 [Saccharospirillum salsuginis]